MSEPTKGLWKVYKGWVHPVLENGSNGNDSFAICECFGPDALFNATLIAASTDLLSAAKRALAVLKAQGESVRPGNALGALEAAIKKATGQ